MVNGENGEVEKTFKLTKNFLWAWEFHPDIPSFCVGMGLHDQTEFGKLPTPEEFHGTMPKKTDQRIRGTFFGNVHLCENLLQYSMLPGAVEKLYFKGEHKTYVQDYRNCVWADVKKSLLCRWMDWNLENTICICSSRERFASCAMNCV